MTFSSARILLGENSQYTPVSRRSSGCFENFRFTDDHIAYLKEQMPQCEKGFFDWLKSVDCSKMKIYALKEGTISYPRVPLMRVQGPIAVAQLLETSTLTLTNYPSLMTTNAAKYRLAVGFDKGLIEFGLRRAQGPDGGVSASRYSYMGGFDGTSNVLAGYLFGVPIRGTHAHSYVQSFTGIEDLKDHTACWSRTEKYMTLSKWFWKSELNWVSITPMKESSHPLLRMPRPFPEGFSRLWTPTIP